MAPRWSARTSSLCCVLATLAAVSADEVLSEEHVADMHPKIDTNKDGKVSLSELEEFAALMRKSQQEQEVQDMLPDFDTDGDGRISKSEFFAKVDGGEEASREADPEANINADHVEGLFSAADRNGDGILEPEEFVHIRHMEGNPAILEQAGQTMIKEYDSNGDGVVTEEEFKPSGEDFDVKSFKKLDKDGNKKLDAMELAPMATGVLGELLDLEETVQRADSDGDGHITLEEMTGAREKISGHLLWSWVPGPKEEL